MQAPNPALTAISARWLPPDQPLPEDAPHHCAHLTLTCHRRKA